jgi:hypothetical protein
MLYFFNSKVISYCISIQLHCVSGDCVTKFSVHFEEFVVMNVVNSSLNFEID